MCILLWTTACANKGYPLILLSNRDEFLQRPTQTAGPWDKDTYGGRDLARPENGTWLGITRRGRFAGLTNIREATSIAAVGTASRGAVVSSFLTSSDSTCQSWIGLGTQGPSAGLDIDQVGGFSMLCGQFSRDQQNRVQIDSLGVISNRAEGQIHERKHEIIDPTKPGTYGLSNSAFTNPWPKVVNGETLLNELVENIQHDRLTDREIAQKGFEILTSDSVSEDEAWKDMRNRLDLLKQSVFIPMFETQSFVSPSDATTTGQDHALSGLYNFYGTQKQTVIIVHESGAVRYVEKTLFDWLQGTTHAANNTVDIIFDLDL
ncbi:hypothetical protein TWF173_002370 [Orbilia oligospora]|uniref:DUF833-domain-containing protein n=2 Tax=Orbilia oligospora TaxID=2813651 RepID=G1X2T3_ARTOA|nr:hypothetical protein AOL_s00043g6 [Orbilia oligospora ATCC 24927]EGX52512.1 hypothetical protein AOL_s00043g6 [Orbilia oligospora ATCC 24927]KAF3269735.1 hypothetical protein TWF970_011249 [Orbilia oligospora]KAF3307759.1 hypothetical protein TWF173_002370 [Orbilia oligospora]